MRHVLWHHAFRHHVHRPNPLLVKYFLSRYFLFDSMISFQYEIFQMCFIFLYLLRFFQGNQQCWATGEWGRRHGQNRGFYRWDGFNTVLDVPWWSGCCRPDSVRNLQSQYLVSVAWFIFFISINFFFHLSRLVDTLSRAQPSPKRGCGAGESMISLEVRPTYTLWPLWITCPLLIMMKSLVSVKEAVQARYFFYTWFKYEASLF